MVPSLAKEPWNVAGKANLFREPKSFLSKRASSLLLIYIPSRKGKSSSLKPAFLLPMLDPTSNRHLQKSSTKLDLGFVSCLQRALITIMNLTKIASLMLCDHTPDHKLFWHSSNLCTAPVGQQNPRVAGLQWRKSRSIQHDSNKSLSLSKKREGEPCHQNSMWLVSVHSNKQIVRNIPWPLTENHSALQKACLFTSTSPSSIRKSKRILISLFDQGSKFLESEALNFQRHFVIQAVQPVLRRLCQGRLDSIDLAALSTPYEKAILPIVVTFENIYVCPCCTNNYWLSRMVHVQLFSRLQWAFLFVNQSTQWQRCTHPNSMTRSWIGFPYRQNLIIAAIRKCVQKKWSTEVKESQLQEPETTHPYRNLKVFLHGL